MPPFLTARWIRYTLLSILALAVLLIAAVYLLPNSQAPNPLYVSMVEKIAAITSYTQEVTTRTTVGDRELTIEGVYHIDGPVARFSSRATTTLKIPNDGEHQFVLENISIDRDVYTRLTTTSDFLRATIPESLEWQHFQSDAIPDRWRDIAISGPTLDVLLLFRAGGSYLEERADTDENERTMLYTISSEAPRNAGGTLGMLLQRIADGDVRLTIDESGMLESVEINGPSYSSIIRIRNVNSTPPIEAPPRTLDGATL